VGAPGRPMLKGGSAKARSTLPGEIRCSPCRQSIS
jgi:hypothetical protein